MEFWKKAQKPAAIASGIVLLLLIVAILVRDYLPAIQITIGQQQSKESESRSVADDQQPANMNDQAPNRDETAAERSVRDTYAYVAQYGSSYTEMVRDAIAQYAQVKQIELSPSQLLTAEVQLANAAGSPELEVGEQVAVAVADIAAVVPVATATSTDAPATKETAQETNEQNPETNDKADTNYVYTAQAGDTYTGFARKALNDHLASTKTTLTPAQYVAAETALAAAAGMPLLQIGTQVTLAKADVSKAVQTASALDSQQQLLWQSYV